MGAPQPGRWWTIANDVRVDDRDRERLAQRIYEAVAEEREACAKIVDDLLESDYDFGDSQWWIDDLLDKLAARIRARTS